MREQLIIERVGHSKSKAEHFTPQVIKNLKPDGCVLHWQYVTGFFQGYYKIPADKLADAEAAVGKKRRRLKGKTEAKTHWSFSRKYGQVRTRTRTQLCALSLVVNWLWNTHADMGFDQCLAAIGSMLLELAVVVSFWLMGARQCLLLGEGVGGQESDSGTTTTTKYHCS